VKFGEVVNALIPAMAVQRVVLMQQSRSLTEAESRELVGVYIADPWTAFAVLTALVEAKDEGNYQEYVNVAKSVALIQQSIVPKPPPPDDFAAFMDTLHREPNK
jgi:hypothetical protein